MLTDEEHQASLDNHVQPVSCRTDRERGLRELYGDHPSLAGYGMYILDQNKLNGIYVRLINLKRT